MCGFSLVLRQEIQEYKKYPINEKNKIYKSYILALTFVKELKQTLSQTELNETYNFIIYAGMIVIFLC